MTPNPPRRVSLRLPDFDYSQEGAYFITICVKGRKYLFGNIVDNEMNLNEFGKIVAATWDDLSFYNPAIKLDAFMVMPNHVHGIIVITGGAEQTLAAPKDGRGDPAPTKTADLGPDYGVL